MLGLSGCAVAPPAPAPARPATPSGAAPVTVPSTRAEPLAAERRWLQSWFQGTPVVIHPSGPTTLGLEVPLVHSFEPGQVQLKPALATVLDKVAESLRRVPQARLRVLAVPAEPPAAAALAHTRGDRIRSHLIGRGISPVRMNAPTVADAPVVRLQMDLGPAGG